MQLHMVYNVITEAGKHKNLRLTLNSITPFSILILLLLSNGKPSQYPKLWRLFVCTKSDRHQAIFSLEKSKPRHCIHPCYNTGVVNDDVVIPPLIKIIAKACRGSLTVAGFCVLRQPTGTTGKKSKPQHAKPLGVQCSH